MIFLEEIYLNKSIPVGQPSSLLPRLKPCTTVPRAKHGNGEFVMI